VKARAILTCFVALASCTRRDAPPEDAHVSAHEDSPARVVDATTTNAIADASTEDAPNAGDAKDASILDAADEDGAALDGSVKALFSSYKNVLHIGDSTVGYRMGLQMELQKMFTDSGAHYTSWSVTSAGLRSFADDRVVEKWIKKSSPDLVLVQLGTNNVTVPHPEAYIKDLKTILAQLGAHACYWIGPISLQFPERGMRGFLRDNVAPCTFFDSYDLTLERQSDGLHPSQKAAKIWADAFWAFANEHPPGYAP
jgi:lysophospholipase L1-like esterase